VELFESDPGHAGRRGERVPRGALLTRLYVFGVAAVLVRLPRGAVCVRLRGVHVPCAALEL
jgi:hypothetical protein